MAVDNKIIYKEIKKINENLETLVAIFLIPLSLPQNRPEQRTRQ